MVVIDETAPPRLAFIPEAFATAPEVACNADCQVGAAAVPACGTGRHRAGAWPSGAFETGHGLHSGCEPGTCTGGDGGEEEGANHPECNEEEQEEFASAFDAFLENQSHYALDALLMSDHHVTVNVERMAVQVLRCDGGVHYHLPVSPEVLGDAF